MAVSACVSGPVFNLLVGLGVSLAVLSAREFPRSIDMLRLDRYSGTAAVLLLFVLIFQLLWLSMCSGGKGWRLTRGMAGFLIAAYAVYSGVVVMLVVL